MKQITPADISDPRDRARGIRDKIAASKRKGLWVGGMAPLGYDTKDRKISINDAEAERVRTVFRSYLRLGSLNRLMADLRESGYCYQGPHLENRSSSLLLTPALRKRLELSFHHYCSRAPTR